MLQIIIDKDEQARITKYLLSRRLASIKRKHCFLYDKNDKPYCILRKSLSEVRAIVDEIKKANEL